jgi:hypothetical protein
MRVAAAQSPQVIDITSIYDTGDAARRIEGMVARLRARFGQEIRFTYQQWGDRRQDRTVDHLDPSAHEDTPALLAVAFDPDGQMQPELLTAACEWCGARRNRHAAMVVMQVNDPLNRGGSVVRILRALAKRSGLDFISPASAPERPDPDDPAWPMAETVGATANDRSPNDATRAGTPMPMSAPGSTSPHL